MGKESNHQLGVLSKVSNLSRDEIQKEEFD